MITPHQKAQVKAALAEAHAINGQIVSFYQDHFYARGQRFGYPVCIQVQNLAENKVETSRILHWSSSQAVCDILVDEIDAYIMELDKGVVNGHS